jgi:hypothetical protein
MPHATTANMAGIGNFLKRVAGSIAHRRAPSRLGDVLRANRPVRAAEAHVFRQFESNTSRLPVGATGGGRNLSDRSENLGEQVLRIAMSAIWNAK